MAKKKSEWEYFSGAPKRFKDLDKWQRWLQTANEFEIVSLWYKFNRIYTETIFAHSRIKREQMTRQAYNNLSQLSQEELFKTHKMAGRWIALQHRYQMLSQRAQPDTDKINAMSASGRWVSWLTTTDNLGMVTVLQKYLIKLINMTKDNKYVVSRRFLGFTERRQRDTVLEARMKVKQRQVMDMGFQSIKLDAVRKQQIAMGEESGREWSPGLCHWCREPTNGPAAYYCDVCMRLQNLGESHENISIFQGNTKFAERWLEIAKEQETTKVDIKEAAKAKPVVDEMDEVFDEGRAERQAKREAKKRDG